MEKLLELLNEYKKHIPYHITEYDEEYQIFRTSLDLPGFVGLPAEIVISNKFGFIEWLTKNNKIKLMGDWEFFYSQDGGRYEEFVNWIMHLSIQDDPISFLVSILK